jgi:spore germination cell wall hydrolase CwlJ-like protein
LTQIQGIKLVMSKLKQQSIWALIVALFVLLILAGVMLRSAHAGELGCLTEAVYYESRGEPLLGQLGVATVILNRVSEGKYGDTVCEVVHHRCSFSYWCDGKHERMPNKKARLMASHVARLALDGASSAELEGATHYHAHYVKPYWSKALTYIGRVGRHLFYRE